VEYNTKGMPVSTVNFAYPMFHGNPVMALLATHRPETGCKNKHIAFLWLQDDGFGLRPGDLFG